MVFIMGESSLSIYIHMHIYYIYTQLYTYGVFNGNILYTRICTCIYHMLFEWYIPLKTMFQPKSIELNGSKWCICSIAVPEGMPLVHVLKGNRVSASFANASEVPASFPFKQV